MKTPLPVSEAEDTAAILRVEPLASSSSAPCLLLLLVSTVACFFRKRWNLSSVQKPGSSTASLQPSFYCRATHSVSVYDNLPIISHTPFARQLLPICFITNYLSHTPSSILHCGFYRPSSVVSSPFSLFCVCFVYLSRGEILCNAGSQMHPCFSSSKRISRHLPRHMRRSCSSHLLAPHSSGSAACSRQSENG